VDELFAGLDKGAACVRPGLGCGHRRGYSRDQAAFSPRPIRGLKNVTDGRGRACPCEKPPGEGDKRRQIAANSLPPFVAFCRSISSADFS